MSTLKVGIAGTGWVAEDFNLPGYEADERVKVTAVADPDASQRRQFVKLVDTVNEYDTGVEMIQKADIDIISICTPPHTHEDIFIEAVSSGCHVFCEKPLTTDYQSAKRMKIAAEGSDSIIQIGHNPRYYANYEKALSIVQEGLLGELKHIDSTYYSDAPPSDWYYEPKVSGGGVVMDKAPHILDVYLDMVQEVPRVTGVHLSEEPQSSVEEEATVKLDTGNTTMELSFGWTVDGLLSRHLIRGTEGWIDFNYDYLKGNIHGNRFEFRHGKLPIIDIKIDSLFTKPSEDPQKRRIHSFIDSVENGNHSTDSSLEKAISIMKIIQMVYNKSNYYGGN